MWPVGLPQHSHHGHKSDLVGLHAARPPNHLLEGGVSCVHQGRAGATGLDEGGVHLGVQLHLLALQLLNDHNINL